VSVLRRYLLLAALVLTACSPEGDPRDQWLVFVATDANIPQLGDRVHVEVHAANDELLGLEALQQELWQGHPYGHAPQGTGAGLESITLDDVRAFYAEHYTRANLVLGVAGGYPAEYPKRLAARLAKLPQGGALAQGATASFRDDELAPPPKVDGRPYTLIDKTTASVGIHSRSSSTICSGNGALW